MTQIDTIEGETMPRRKIYVVSSAQAFTNPVIHHVEAESEHEAREEVIDHIWSRTDENVWVNDGYAPGEEGFNRWIEDTFTIEVLDRE